MSCHDPDKVIFNNFPYKMSDLEPLPPMKLNYGDNVAPFELFYREIRKLPIEVYELELLSYSFGKRK